jgi:hypothetical protein
MAVASSLGNAVISMNAGIVHLNESGPYGEAIQV